jgi:hypothetical protein
MSHFKPLMLRVPMFAGMNLKQPVGLGQVVKKVTTRMGIAPCGGCNKRAAALDRMVVFVPVDQYNRDKK